MRTLSVPAALAAATLLSACATQTAPPAKPATAPAAKAPQCWNADANAFQDIGTRATIAGVAVECKPSADGKSAQWMGVGAKH